MQPIVVSGSDSIFTTGTHLAFFGRSNVGKSSTINALLGTKTAKVSSTPGKTITFNFYDISEGEQQRFLVDLPGYGYARHGEQFREKLRRRLIWYLTDSGADIEKFCLVIDAKAGLTELDHSAIDLARQTDQDLVILVNKIDRLNQKNLAALRKELIKETEGLDNVQIFYYSAKTKKGIDKVKSALELE